MSRARTAAPCEADAWSDPRDESGLLGRGSDQPRLHQLARAHEAGRGVEAARRRSRRRLRRSAARRRPGPDVHVLGRRARPRARRLLLRGRQGHRRDLPRHLRAARRRGSRDGRLLVEGKTWTGFANSEERFADDFVGQKIQPFWIEDEAKKLENTNFIVSGRFKPHAVRDGNLITGPAAVLGQGGRAPDDRGAGDLRPMLASHPIDPMILATDLAVAQGVLRRPDRARGPDRERRLPDLQMRRRQPPRRHPQHHRHQRAADQGLVARGATWPRRWPSCARAASRSRNTTSPD